MKSPVNRCNTSHQPESMSQSGRGISLPSRVLSFKNPGVRWSYRCILRDLSVWSTQWSAGSCPSDQDWASVTPIDNQLVQPGGMNWNSKGEPYLRGNPFIGEPDWRGSSHLVWTYSSRGRRQTRRYKWQMNMKGKITTFPCDKSRGEPNVRGKNYFLTSGSWRKGLTYWYESYKPCSQ